MSREVGDASYRGSARAVRATTVGGARKLGGVRVLELTNSVAGSMAGMLLADLGVDVVRIHQGTDPCGLEPGFLVWNRNKRALRFDSSNPDDLAPFID